MLQEAESILASQYHQILSNGLPADQIAGIDKTKTVRQLRVIDHKKITNDMDAKNAWYGANYQIDIFAFTDLRETDYAFVGGDLHKKDPRYRKVEAPKVLRWDNHLDPIEIEYEIEIELREGFKQKLKSKLEGIQVLFSGDSGLEHLIALNRGLEDLHFRINNLMETFSDLISAMEDEDRIQEDIEEIDELDKEVARARDAFFGR